MSLSADIDSSVDLLGKIVTDLQDEVTVSGDAISGTLLYVDDYTGFSGDPAPAKGISSQPEKFASRSFMPPCR